jgi:DNA adenine methylase
MEDKYPNLKNVVYNDFNQLNWNLFENVRGSNYKQLKELLNSHDCQPYKTANTLEEVENFKNTFNSYQKEIFADGFEINDDNSKDVAMKYAFVLTQIFSGSQPEKSKYMDFKGKYKPKFRTFREKLTIPKYDKFQKQLEKITVSENMDFGEVIKKYDSPSTYFYVDPPYWKTENYYSKHDFDRDDHERLCLQLKSIQGRWGLSYYDFELLQEWLPKNEFVWEEKQFTKQAGTPGKKNGVKQPRAKGTELLIMNYKIEEEIEEEIKKENKLIGEFF